MKTNKRHLMERLKNNIKFKQDAIAKFQKNLSEDPQYAFQWGDDAMRAAAIISVSHWALRMLGDEYSVEDLIKRLNDSIMSNAKFPKQSTSQVSNIAEIYKTMAMAEVAEIANEHKER